MVDTFHRKGQVVMNDRSARVMEERNVITLSCKDVWDKIRCWGWGQWKKMPRHRWEKKGSVMIINKKTDDTARRLEHWGGIKQGDGTRTRNGVNLQVAHLPRKAPKDTLPMPVADIQKQKKCSRNKWVQSRDQKHCIWVSATLTTEPTAGAARRTEDAVQRQTQHTLTHTGTFHYSTLNDICRNRESRATGGNKVRLK